MNKSPCKPIQNTTLVAASEERFRALIAATSDVIYSLSADWRVMHELDGRGFLKNTHNRLRIGNPGTSLLMNRIK